MGETYDQTEHSGGRRSEWQQMPTRATLRETTDEALRRRKEQISATVPTGPREFITPPERRVIDVGAVKFTGVARPSVAKLGRCLLRAKVCERRGDSSRRGGQCSCWSSRMAGQCSASIGMGVLLTRMRDGRALDAHA
eukprot:2332416-Pleurochrysis_carterae.AAC.1